MSGLPYIEGRKRNYYSYEQFDIISIGGFARAINVWRRKTLELPEVRLGLSTAITSSGVPFSAMWSPSFVPKPKDWPEQCRVVGTFVPKPKPENEKKFFDESKFADLSEWIAAGPPPFFLGFGSMVIEDTDGLSEMIKKAVIRADCRIIVQSSWSKIDVTGEPRCHNVGPCPHDWLLPKTAGVIHHGGAGTTAAGLRHGLPTFICPFFADQYMWAAMTKRAGVGPEPCPIDDLTEDILVERLVELGSPELKSKAMWMAEQMAKEDGIQGGLDHFLSSIPRDNAFCDVSILLGEDSPADVRLTGSGLKVSMEVASLLTLKTHSDSLGQTSRRLTNPCRELWDLQKHWQRSQRYGSYHMKPHAVMRYAIGRVESVGHGCFTGSIGFLQNIIFSPFQIFFKPDRYARSHGAFGCLWGLLISPLFVVYMILRAVVVLVDRIVVGICNGCCGTHMLYFIDRTSYASIHSVVDLGPQLQTLASRGLSRTRKHELFLGLDMAITAREVWKAANPKFPAENWHYRVVKAADLIPLVPRLRNSVFELSDAELETLERRLGEMGNATLSFSRFCALLRQDVIAKRTRSMRPSRESMRGRQPSLAEIFLTEEEVEHLMTSTY
jgi:hypothetical protein